jgi:flagellar M-ring protein FliF
MADITATPQDIALNTLTQTPGASPPQAMAERQSGQLTSQSDATGLDGIIRRTIPQQAIPAIIALMTIVLFILIYSWSQSSPYRTVYPGLSEADRQFAFEALSSADFSAKIDTHDGELKVPSSRYHEARLYLASQGLPKSTLTGSVGAMSETAAMTTSQFMEQVRYISAIEIELAASVAKISTIESARVHLASPKQSVFVRNREAAKASVVVSPYPGRIVSESQVQAIIHLIASSVPYLATENVSVVDQRGKLLTNVAGSTSLMSNNQMAHKQSREETYRNRINAFLSPIVGMGNVRSEVDMQIDFTEIESTYEEYDGNAKGPRARSEILTMEQRGDSQAIGIPGASSNTVPADNDADDVSNALNKNMLSSKTTRNYEMDRAIRHVKRQGGLVERISVAVVLNPPSPKILSDDDRVEGANVDSAEFSELELERFSNLVKSLIGFNAERGDVVTIVSARFEPPEVVEPISEPWYENSQMTSLTKNSAIAAAFIALLLLVVKPAIGAYSSPAVPLDSAVNASAGRATNNSPGPSSSLGGESRSLRSYEDKVDVVRTLLANDPARVANVLKDMIQKS